MVRLGLTVVQALARCGPLGVALALGLGCAGLGGGDEPECCTVDDVITLTQDGVPDEVILDAIRTSGTDLSLSALDLKRLADGGVSPTVIDVLNGGPCVCVDDPVVPTPTTPGPMPTGRSLDVTVKYNGGKNFELVNRSKDAYTHLVLMVNDDYEYQLERLAPNTGQFVRLGSFVSTVSGEDGKGVVMEKIVVTADQGSYFRTF